MTTQVSDNYSIETMIRYAFDYEVQNHLKTIPNWNEDPKLRSLVEYLEKRIQEIAVKFK